MAFIPVTNGAMVLVECDVSNLTTINNTLWFSQASFDSTDLETLRDYIVDWWSDHVMVNLCTAVSLVHVTAYDMRTENGAKSDVAVSGVTGSVATDIGSINSAAVITFYTGYRGRSFRGRNFVAGFPEADMGALGFTSTTHINSVRTAYDLLLTEPVIDGWTWGVCSRYTGGAPRANGIITPVTNTAIRNAYFGSQRRRINRA